MTKRKKTCLVITLSSVLALLAVSSGLTLAAYKSVVPLDQTAGYQGRNNVKSIFLDINIQGGVNKCWDGQLTNGTMQSGSHAVYYLYAFDSTAPGSTFEWFESTIIKPTISSIPYYLLSFQIDISIYDKFEFVRFNPNGTYVPSWDRDGGSLWDQTDAITYDSTNNYNYYLVDLSQPRKSVDNFDFDAIADPTAGKIRAATASDATNDPLVFVS